MGRRTRLLAVITAVTIGSTVPAAGEQRGDDPVDITLHAGALSELIDEIGGRGVFLPRARVIAMLNPRAILVESATALRAPAGHLDRVLVLIDTGQLSVTAAALVGRTVAVRGVARTLLGLEVSREVPWPPQLTRPVLDRYEIKAGVLADSVRTSDGVELARPE